VLVLLEELKFEYVLREENPQLWPMENFWANLNSNNYHPKNVKLVLDGKDQKLQANAQKAHKLGVT
jgi:hypothetical protein